jgi:hypothetical protein
MEARGTLGMRMRNPPRIFVPISSTMDNRVYFFSCANIEAFGGVLYETPPPQMPLLQKMVHH